MLSILLAATLAAPTAKPCEYIEPKKPPTFEVMRNRGVDVRHRADARWFNCRKKAGDTLEVIFSVGEKEPLEPLLTKQVRSYSFRESLGYKQLCATGPGAKKIRAEIRGTGELEKLNWTSEIGELYCERCEFRGYDNMLVLHSPGTHLSPKGFYTIEGTLDGRWFECAREGSTLSLHVYAAQTQLEAREMKEPTHRIRGLESKHFKKRIDQKTLCKGKPKWLGYELHGTGEFTVLNGRGRGLKEARCP